MKLSVGSNETTKPIHFEETHPEEDAAAIEVRLTPRASHNDDVLDVGEDEDTYNSSESQASSTSLSFWTWRGLGFAALAFFILAVTVGVKNQQQKKIAAAAMIQQDCIEDRAQAAASPWTISSPYALAAGDKTPELTPPCLTTGTQCDGTGFPPTAKCKDDCCSGKFKNCGASDKFCTATQNDPTFSCPTPVPTTAPPTQEPTQCTGLQNGVQCDGTGFPPTAKCQDDCCSGKFKNCGASDKFCTATGQNDPTFSCPTPTPGPPTSSPTSGPPTPPPTTRPPSSPGPGTTLPTSMKRSKSPKVKSSKSPKVKCGKSPKTNSSQRFLRREELST